MGHNTYECLNQRMGEEALECVHQMNLVSSLRNHAHGLLGK